jgi:hypothetical protein
MNAVNQALRAPWSQRELRQVLREVNEAYLQHVFKSVTV